MSVATVEHGGHQSEPARQSELPPELDIEMLQRVSSVATKQELLLHLADLLGKHARTEAVFYCPRTPGMRDGETAYAPRPLSTDR